MRISDWSSDVCSSDLLYAAWIVGERIVSWGIIHATFIADDRSGCNPGGACWAFVVNRLPQFLFGFYPEAERWRALAAVLAPPALMLLAVAPEFRGRRLVRLEERRVGKECVRTCRSRWSPAH